MYRNVVTEMSPDGNGQTEMSRDQNGPNRNGSDRNGQTEKSCSGTYIVVSSTQQQVPKLHQNHARLDAN